MIVRSEGVVRGRKTKIRTFVLLIICVLGGCVILRLYFKVVYVSLPSALFGRRRLKNGDLVSTYCRLLLLSSSFVSCSI